MKKTLSIVALALAAVLMMTALVACGGSTKLEAGTYKLVEAGGDGAEEYNSLKDSITLEVKDDGKAKMQFSGTDILEMEFDEESGKVSIDDQAVSYKIDGGKIIIEDSEGKLVFQK